MTDRTLTLTVRTVTRRSWFRVAGRVWVRVPNRIFDLIHCRNSDTH